MKHVAGHNDLLGNRDYDISAGVPLCNKPSRAPIIRVLGQSFCGIETLVAAFDPDASVILAESPLPLAVPAAPAPVGSLHFVTVTVCDRLAGRRVQVLRTEAGTLDALVA